MNLKFELDFLNFSNINKTKQKYPYYFIRKSQAKSLDIYPFEKIKNFVVKSF